MMNLRPYRNRKASGLQNEAGNPERRRGTSLPGRQKFASWPAAKAQNIRRKRTQQAGGRGGKRVATTIADEGQEYLQYTKGGGGKGDSKWVMSLREKGSFPES